MVITTQTKAWRSGPHECKGVFDYCFLIKKFTNQKERGRDMVSEIFGNHRAREMMERRHYV